MKAKPWQVWFADLGTPVGHEQRGRRPVVVVSSQFHARLPNDVVLVVPLTTRNRALPHHVCISSTESGLSRPSWARTEDLYSISLGRMLSHEPLGVLTPDEIAHVRRWVRRMVDV